MPAIACFWLPIGCPLLRVNGRWAVVERSLTVVERRGPPPRSMWSRKRGIAVCINGQCTPHALRMLSACLAHMPTVSRWHPDGIHRVSRWYVSLFFMCRFQCRLCSSFVRFPLGSILVRYAQYRGVRIFLRFFIQERERRDRLGSVACVHEGVTSTCS